MYPLKDEENMEMLDGQFIVVQGPTTFYKEIIECYRTIPNVIFSTLNNEPMENCKALQEYFPVIISPFNFERGFGNINCQCKTSTEGLQLARSMGASYALKIRSDMIISDISKFSLALQKHTRLSFLAWHNNEGYLVDYLNYGPINEIIDFWNVYAVNSYTCERNLMNNFSRIKNAPIWTLEDAKKHVDFFMGDLIEMQIRIDWLKYNIVVSDYYKDPCYKY